MLLLVLLLTVVAGTPVLAQSHRRLRKEPQQINPPFGLEWGESADRLEKLLKGSQGRYRGPP